MQHLRAVHPPLPWSSASLFSPLDLTLQKLLVVWPRSFYLWRSTDDPLETTRTVLPQGFTPDPLLIPSRASLLFPALCPRGVRRWHNPPGKVRVRLWTPGGHKTCAKSLPQSQPTWLRETHPAGNEWKRILFAKQNTSHRYHCLCCTFDTHSREKMLHTHQIHLQLNKLWQQSWQFSLAAACDNCLHLYLLCYPAKKATTTLSFMVYSPSICTIKCMHDH